jgi:hypothetical protein
MSKEGRWRGGIRVGIRHAVSGADVRGGGQAGAGCLTPEGVAVE